MTGLLTYEQFRVIRDAAALAFCEQEIATYTPIEAALAKEVRAVTEKLAHAKKHDKQALESEQRRAGQAWQDVSARLHAAVAMYEVLTGSKRLEGAA